MTYQATDPIEIGPEDTTGLGDRGDEGDTAPNPGRAIARQWHRHPKSFIAVLRQLDQAAWLPLAQAYAQWRGTTPEQTLDTWLLATQGAQVPDSVRYA